MAAKRKPSKPSPKPAEKPKRGRGRPEGTGFHPTDEQRSMVRAMAGYRIPQDEMCLLIINPKNKLPISLITLRKHFSEEIRQGYAHLKTRIMAATVRNALGEVEQLPDGRSRVLREGNVTAQIWLGKTLLGMREKVDIEAPPVIDEADDSTLDAARRVAFTMAMGAKLAEKKGK